MNQAEQLLSLFMVMVKVLVVPEHAPNHPLKIDPDAAAAVRFTEVPLLYGSEQSEPQLIPAGLLVTVPEPVPDLVMTKL